MSCCTVFCFLSHFDLCIFCLSCLFSFLLIFSFSFAAFVFILLRVLPFRYPCLAVFSCVMISRCSLSLIGHVVSRLSSVVCRSLRGRTDLCYFCPRFCYSSFCLSSELVSLFCRYPFLSGQGAPRKENGRKTTKKEEKEKDQKKDPTKQQNNENENEKQKLTKTTEDHHNLWWDIFRAQPTYQEREQASTLVRCRPLHSFIYYFEKYLLFHQFVIFLLFAFLFEVVTVRSGTFVVMRA